MINTRKHRTASSLTYDERKRQIQKEGWTTEHDDMHQEGELCRAALCYAQSSVERDLPGGDIDLKTALPYNWPFESDSWKPSPEDRAKELIKSGALYRAEIERLTRCLEKVHVAIAKIKNIKP